MVSAGVVFGSFIVLALSVATTAPLKIVAPVTLLAVVLTTGYRRLLRWEALLTGLILVVLFVPIRRYTLPGGVVSFSVSASVLARSSGCTNSTNGLPISSARL